MKILKKYLYLIALMTLIVNSSNINVDAAAKSKQAAVAYQLNNLALTNAAQNFYIYNDYIYVTQTDTTTYGDNTYITKCKISGNTASPVINSDGYYYCMKISGAGHGTTFDMYNYNGKLYFLVGSRSDSNGMARLEFIENCRFKKSSSAKNASVLIQTKPGSTVNIGSLYTEIKNFKFSGNNIGVKRTEGFYTDKQITFIEIDENNKITICYYDGNKLNAELDNGDVNLLKTSIKPIKKVTNLTRKGIFPYSHWQGTDGIKYDSSNAKKGDIYTAGNTTTSESSQDVPMINKLDCNGNVIEQYKITRLRLLDGSINNVKNSTEIEGVRLKNDSGKSRLYFILPRPGGPGTIETQVVCYINL